MLAKHQGKETVGMSTLAKSKSLRPKDTHLTQGIPKLGLFGSA